MSFKVKLDMPIILVLILVIAVLAMPVFLYYPSAVSVAFVLIIAVVLFGCLRFTYELDGKWLAVRFGFLSWRFRIDKIRALVPLQKPYRFKLVYGKNSIAYLSVKDYPAFAAALMSELDKRNSLRSHPGQE